MNANEGGWDVGGETKPGDCFDESDKHGGDVNIIKDPYAGDSNDTQPIK